MKRMIREFIEIEDHVPLDQMIEQLTSIRDMLPPGAQEAQVRMTGDDVFGRKLSISYLRPQTSEEADRDARYAAAHRNSRRRQITEMQAELDADEGTPAGLGIAA